MAKGFCWDADSWTGRRCTVCGDPVADDVVPAEAGIDGRVILECLGCWQDRLEERGTLLARTFDGTLTK